MNSNPTVQTSLAGRGRRARQTIALCLAWGVFLSLSGCTMAPKYTRPAAPVSAQWPSGAAYEQGRASADVLQAADLNWRQFFPDEKLQKVIGLALDGNRDLRVAALNVERARALYGIQRQELLPAVGTMANGSKTHTSGDIPSAGQQPRTTEQYSVDLGILSWEIDFFGRIRSLTDEALENYLATEQARLSAQILLVSSTANAYLTLAADLEGLALAEDTFKTQKATYDLIQRQFAAGIANELDLRRAQTPMETARRDAARLTQQVAQDENALNLLVGSPVPSELLPATLAAVGPTQNITAGTSSEVLLRRPDVLQAERMLKAANADIGAARAAFFPRISLTTAVGAASEDLSGLFKSHTGTWSYAPQIVMPLFDARTWSGYKVTKVQRELAVTQYERAIQSAFREVADALAVRGTVDLQLSAQQSLVNALAETHRLATSRYEKGIDSYLSVLDAQRSLFAAQQALISLQFAKAANQVTLYAALGGGWQSAQEPAEERAETAKTGDGPRPPEADAAVSSENASAPPAGNSPSAQGEEANRK